MNEQTRTEVSLEFDEQERALCCQNCDVFPQIHPYLAQRSCCCTTVPAGEAFPTYWVWWKAESGA